MPETNICRLCASICRDYKQLYDDVEVYEITIKYFDPTFLSMKRHTVVCFECWCHIVDFHNFQQTVLMAQDRFAEADDNKALTKHKILNRPGKECDSLNASSSSKMLHKVNPPYQAVMCSSKNLALSLAEEGTSCHPPTEVLNKSITIKKEVELEDDYLDDNMLVPELLIPNYDFEAGTKNSDNDISKASSSPQQWDAASQEDTDDDQDSHDFEVNYQTKTRKSPTAKKTNKMSRETRHTSAVELDRRIAQWRPTLECCICHKSCPNFTTLRTHFNVTHPKGEFYVMCCERKFKLRSRLEEHLHWHSNIPYKCEPCGKEFRWKVTLTRHIHKCLMYRVEHHKIKRDDPDVVKHILKQGLLRKYRCNYCAKSYISTSSLREHMSIHTGKDLYACKLCPMTFNYRAIWRLHLKREHDIIPNGQQPIMIEHMDNDKDKDKYIREAVKKHKCTECEKSYTSLYSLREHMAIHTGKDMYSCHHCPKTFKYRYAWIMHEINEHGQKPLKSQKAKKLKRNANSEDKVEEITEVFESSSEVIKSEPSLREQELYSTTCKGNESQKVKLETNIEIEKLTIKAEQNVKGRDDAVATTAQSSKNSSSHHLIRKFQCELCEKSYVHAKSLREHVATHTEKNHYVCPQCPKTFKYRSTWRLHQKKAHPKRQLKSKR